MPNAGTEFPNPGRVSDGGEWGGRGFQCERALRPHLHPVAAAPVWACKQVTGSRSLGRVLLAAALPVPGIPEIWWHPRPRPIFLTCM